MVSEVDPLGFTARTHPRRIRFMSTIVDFAVWRRAVRARRLLWLVVLAPMALAACGSSSSSSSAGPAVSTSAAVTAPAGTVTPPPAIASAKQLVICSDEVEPPFAYLSGSTLTGSEVDIMNGAAQLMGVKPVYTQIGFDGLFAALDAGKCDVAIDEVSDTAAREDAIADVDYMAVGQTFMVKSGNPLKLTSFSSLCGHDVGAVLASVDLAYLQVLSKNCTSSGKSAITVVGYNDDPTGVEALLTGKVDAFEEDTPILSGLIAQAGGQVELSPQAQVQRIPCGIAVAPKNTGLQQALDKALNLLYANGSMPKIFAKYHQAGVALTGAAPVSIDAATHPR
jgi:polar amino acid transport system substrate-binding protein